MGGSKHICIDPIYDRNPPSTYWTSLTSTFPELDRAMAFSQLARCRRRGPGGNMCGRRLGVKGFMGSREIKTKIEWILWIRSNFASNISLPLGDLKPWWLRGRQKSLGSRWRTWQRSGTILNAFGNTWGTTLRKLCFMTISRFVWLMLQRHTFFPFWKQPCFDVRVFLRNRSRQFALWGSSALLYQKVSREPVESEVISDSWHIRKFLSLVKNKAKKSLVSTAPHLKFENQQICMFEFSPGMANQ